MGDRLSILAIVSDFSCRFPWLGTVSQLLSCRLEKVCGKCGEYHSHGFCLWNHNQSNFRIPEIARAKGVRCKSEQPTNTAELISQKPKLNKLVPWILLQTNLLYILGSTNIQQARQCQGFVPPSKSISMHCTVYTFKQVFGFWDF